MTAERYIAQVQLLLRAIPQIASRWSHQPLTHGRPRACSWHSSPANHGDLRSSTGHRSAWPRDEAAFRQMRVGRRSPLEARPVGRNPCAGLPGFSTDVPACGAPRLSDRPLGPRFAAHSALAGGRFGKWDLSRIAGVSTRVAQLCFMAQYDSLSYILIMSHDAEGVS